MRRANARIVDVFPVPGGPYRRRCGKRCRYHSKPVITNTRDCDKTINSACSRRIVENPEEYRKNETYIRFDKPVDGGKDVMMPLQILDRARSIFLDPEIRYDVNQSLHHPSS